MPDLIDRLMELEANATPAPWQAKPEAFLSHEIAPNPDTALIAALRNAAPALLAVAKAARSIERGCSCDYDHRCTRCDAIVRLQDALAALSSAISCVAGARVSLTSRLGRGPMEK